MSVGIYRACCFFLFVNILSVGQLCGQGTSHRVSILSSEIRVSGETNVNSFACELFIPTITDTLRVASRKSDLNLSFTNLKLSYGVKNFDCGLEAMNKDFRDILKASEYPKLYLQINEIQISKASEGFEKLDVVADVTVTIAGTSRRLLIRESTIINTTESDLVLRGVETVKMTDFGIEPPTRFWGTLRVYDQLEIAFKIQMHVETK